MLNTAELRQAALDLASNRAWTDFVRPEIDRQIHDYEEAILNSPALTDRELADTRTAYHAVQRILKELHSKVLGSIAAMSDADRMTFSPDVHAKLTSLFALHPATPSPIQEQRPISDPLHFPAAPSFNPFSSRPPAEETPAATT